MIRIKELIPEIYNTSHDFKIFEALLEAVFNKSDTQKNVLFGLHSPERCFDENLGKLANLFDLPTSDRSLLKYYRLMRKSKGTKQAVEATIEACGATVEGDPVISYDSSSFRCQVVYEVNFGTFNIRLFDILRRRLIEFGCQLQLRPYIPE